MKNQPLTIELFNDELVIRIGVDTLSNAAISSPCIVEGVDGEVVVSDSKLFADRVIELMKDDSDDGLTPVQQMFDEVFGSTGQDGSIPGLLLKTEE